MDDSGRRPVGGFEVAVAIQAVPAAGTAGGSGPGYDEASGEREWLTRQGGVVLEKGQQAVREATEAMARQIDITARTIAAQIGAQSDDFAATGGFHVDAVEVSFGITLSGGVQALFTAQAESSAQVTISMTRNQSGE